LYFMTFLGKRRWTSDVHPHEAPLTMTVPMMVLSLGSGFLGLLLIPTGVITGWLNPVFGSGSEAGLGAAEEHPVIPPLAITVATILLVAAGVVLACARYIRGEVPQTAPSGSARPQRRRRRRPPGSSASSSSTSGSRSSGSAMRSGSTASRWP